MQTETARMLIDTITNALNMAIDNRNKLTAFEKSLEKHDPNLFRNYLKNLDEVRLNPPTSISLEGFANLQSKLAQET